MKKKTAFHLRKMKIAEKFQITWTGRKTYTHALPYGIISVLQIIIHNAAWFTFNQHMPFHGIAFEFVCFDFNFFTLTCSLNKTRRIEKKNSSEIGINCVCVSFFCCSAYLLLFLLLFLLKRLLSNTQCAARNSHASF